MKITVWKRYDDRLRKFVHNHIECGHINPKRQFPLPKADYVAQRNWRSGTWVKSYANLIDGKVVPE